IQDRSPTAPIEYEDPIAKATMVATFMPVPVGDHTWVVVAQQPRDEAYAPIYRMRTQIGWATVILAVAAIASVLTLGQISRRNWRLNRDLAERTMKLQAQARHLSQTNAELEREVEERKRAEESLHESEVLYHSLVENLPQNILRKDRQGRFTFANQRFCKELGRSLPEIKGKTDFDLYSPDLATKYQQDDKRVMEGGIAIETVEANVNSAGEKIYVQVLKTPIHDADGQVVGVQGIFWDVTERY